PKFAAFPKKNGIPATLAMASRLVAALFRHALEVELAAAASYVRRNHAAHMSHAKRKHCAL
ncbi:MAG: hypothetical protein LBC69_00855, partial [Eubacteriaceae bacterium]|nr:hypothetical protein [Eubacteriaceae bacterium]